MSLKATLRKMAAERNGPTQLVAVLNDPTKVVAIPVRYRKELFAEYGISEDDLIGDAPFHMVFVREGVAFCILSQDQGRERITIHGIDLRPGVDEHSDANLELVGSEVYDMWKSFSSPQLLTYDQLTKNYSTVHKRIERAS